MFVLLSLSLAEFSLTRFCSNGATVHDSAQMPHGGWKHSGFGRFNGFEGIRCVSWLRLRRSES